MTVFSDEEPKRRFEVPGEDGEWFEVRLLSWTELEECRTERARKFMGRYREMGDVIASLAELERKAAADDQKAQAALEAARAENDAASEDPREQFDKAMLLSRSVEGWSFDRKFSKAALTNLKESASDWLFEEVARMYAPTEADAKNASAPSTAT